MNRSAVEQHREADAVSRIQQDTRESTPAVDRINLAAHDRQLSELQIVLFVTLNPTMQDLLQTRSSLTHRGTRTHGDDERRQRAEQPHRRRVYQESWTSARCPATLRIRSKP